MYTKVTRNPQANSRSPFPHSPTHSIQARAAGCDAEAHPPVNLTLYSQIPGIGQIITGQAQYSPIPRSSL